MAALSNAAPKIRTATRSRVPMAPSRLQRQFSSPDTPWFTLRRHPLSTCRAFETRGYARSRGRKWLEKAIFLRSVGVAAESQVHCTS
jgi:hypothetical protein